MAGERFDISSDLVSPTVDFSVPPNGSFLPEDQKACREAFERNGVVLVRNVGDLSRSELLDLLRTSFPFQEWGGDYIGGANARNGAREANVYDVGVPPEASVLFHHEMQYMQNSVQALAFYCEESSGDPEATPTLLSDSRAALRQLEDTDLLQTLRSKGVAYHRGLTDARFYAEKQRSDKGPGAEAEQQSAHYNHWQNCFETTDQNDAEDKARACGLSSRWTSDPRHPESDRYMLTQFVATPDEEEGACKYLFATLADSEEWFRSWPLLGEWKDSELPLHMTYGDGAPIKSEEREKWWRAVHANCMRVDWKKGDLLVLCNLRWAHGRPEAISSSLGRKINVTFGSRLRRSAHSGIDNDICTIDDSGSLSRGWGTRACAGSVSQL